MSNAPLARDSSVEGFSWSWRGAAVAGLLVSLLGTLWASLRVGYASGLLVFLGLFVATAVLGWLGFAPARRRLLARLDLLVPVGVMLLTQELVIRLVVLTGIPELTRPWTIGPPWAGPRLSALGALLLPVWTAFVAWQTDLLIQDVNTPSAKPAHPWEAIRRGFWPCAGALVVGSGVAGLAEFVFTPPLVLFCIPLGYLGVLVGWVAMVAIGLGWNLATAALLPTVLLHSGPIRSRLRQGIRLSVQKGGWQLRLIAQILLMGLVTYFMNTTDTTPDWRLNVHPDWLGGYHHEGYWYVDAIQYARQRPFPLFQWILEVEFLVLAVGLKWLIIGRLVAKPGVEVTMAGDRPSA